MKHSKRARLEARGWRVGSAGEFLDLTPEEAAFVETKLALSRYVRDRRTAQNVSQSVLAKRLKSSQSRVAKMEAADPTVSIDLLLKALFALGAKPKDIATAIQKRATVAAQEYGDITPQQLIARHHTEASMRVVQRADDVLDRCQDGSYNDLQQLLAGCPLRVL